MKKNNIYVVLITLSFFGSSLASCIPNKIQDLTLSFRTGNVQHITDSDIKISGPILTHEMRSFIENDKNPENDVFAESLIEKKFLNIIERQRLAYSFLLRLQKRLNNNGFMNETLVEKFIKTKKDIDNIVEKN